jgi:hypothetical protein
MSFHFGLLIFHYDIDIMFLLAVELKKKKKIYTAPLVRLQFFEGVLTLLE